MDAVLVDDLGALIQRRMEEKGWTITEIARRSELSVSTVHAWATGIRASGSRGPNPDKLRKLAKGMQLTVAEVFEAAGRRVPGTLTDADQRRFMHLLGELSESDRRVVEATMEAMIARDRS